MKTQYSSLYEKSNYRNPIPYLINTLIYEYDLSKANISALLYTGIINQNEYDYYLSLDKIDRQTQIGYKYLMNNDSNNKKLSEAFRYARERLFKDNNILDNEIISIKNDAVFVTRQLKYTIFDMFEFKTKNIYSSYIYLVNLELYYQASFLNGVFDFNIDIKGINNKLIHLHENGFLQILGNTFYQIERGSTIDLISYLMSTYEKFIRRQLPLEYYRNFNHSSKYSAYTNIFSYELDYINQKDLQYISIDRNLQLLRELIRIVSSINKF